MIETKKTSGRIYNSSLTKWDRIRNGVKFNLNYIFSNKNIAVILSVFLISSWILPVIFVPYFDAVAYFLLLNTSIPCLLVLGSLSYAFKKSSLYKNMYLSGQKDVIFYLNQFITISILDIVMSFIFWVVLWLMGFSGILLADFSFLTNEKIPQGTNIFAHYLVILYLFYSITICMILTFLCYVFLESLVRHKTNYYMLVTIILFFGIIFCGALNTYFSNPNGVAEGKNFEYDSSTNTAVGEMYYGPYVNGFSGNLFPDYMFIPSMIICPFYGIGEFGNQAVGRLGLTEILYQSTNVWQSAETVVHGTIHHIDIFGKDTIIKDTDFLYYGDLSNRMNLIYVYFSKYSWKWSLVVLQPYLYMAFFTLSSAALRLARKK